MEPAEIEPGPGVVLIAHPWLPDPNFQRTVILLCEHKFAEGTFGLVMSRPLESKLGDVIEQLEPNQHRIFEGGPVQRNTLHYIHRLGGIIDSAIEIQDDLFWGGDFDLVEAMVLADETSDDNIRFFMGYSGWGPGQLSAEIEEGSWILTRAPADVLLDADTDALWRTLLRRMGGQFALLSNFPQDPRNN